MSEATPVPVSDSPAPRPGATAPLIEEPDAGEFGPSDAELIAQLAGDAPPPAPSTPPAPAAADPATTTAPVLDTTASPVPAGADVEARIKEYVERQHADVTAKLAEKRALEELRAERDALKARLEQTTARLKDDPLGLAAEQGWDFEALAKRAVGEETPGAVEIRRMRDEMRQMRAEMERSNKEAAQAAEAQRAQAAVAQWRASIVPTIEAKGDAFKTARALFTPEELTDRVHDVVQRVWNGSGGSKLLSVEEAAAYLEHQAQQRLERIRPLVTTAPQQAAPVPGSPAHPKPVPGLNNLQTQSAPPDIEDLSDTALRARALAFARENGLE